MKRHLLTGIFRVCLLLALLLAAVPARVAANPGTSITFTPDALHVEKGESFSVDVIINTTVPILGGQAGFSFNPDVLRCNSITQKGKMITDWVDTHGGSADENVIIYPTGRIDNATGTIDTLGVIIVGMGGVGPSGSGIFCTLNFTALGIDGVSSLSMTSPRITSTEGQSVAALEVGMGRVIVGQPEGPDLAIESFAAEWQDQDEGLYLVNFTVKNTGTQVAAETTAHVNITNPDPDDPTKQIVLQTEVAVGALGPGATEDSTAGPFTIEGDSDLIELIVDATDMVAEVDEYNNKQTMTWLKFGPPDLKVVSASYAWDIQNQSYTLSYTIKNVGTGKAASSQTAIEADGTRVVLDTVPELKPGGSYRSQELGPFNFAGYNDIIEIYLDIKNSVEETATGESELNNYYRFAVTRSFTTGQRDNIVLFDLSDTSAFVTWRYYSTAVAYRMNISTNVSTPTGIVSTVVYEQEVKYTEIQLPADALQLDTTYTARVWARVPKAPNNATLVYRLVYTKTFTTLPVPPLYSAHLKPAHGAYDIPVQATFAWDPVSGARSYELELSTQPGFAVGEQTRRFNLDVNYLSLDAPLEYDTAYYWRVRALGDGGNGAWVVSTFTTAAKPPVASPLPSLPQASFSVTVTVPPMTLAYPEVAVAISEEAEQASPPPVFASSAEEIPYYFYLALGSSLALVLLALVFLMMGDRRG